MEVFPGDHLQETVEDTDIKHENLNANSDQNGPQLAFFTLLKKVTVMILRTKRTIFNICEH